MTSTLIAANATNTPTGAIEEHVGFWEDIFDALPAQHRRPRPLLPSKVTHRSHAVDVDQMGVDVGHVKVAQPRQQLRVKGGNEGKTGDEVWG